MSNITIKDVAALAGVSVKTVSRVLNKEANVRDVMIERVNKAVKELNFTPNPMARGLRGHKTFIISLLYSNPNPGYIVELQKGAMQQGSIDGYNLQIFPCDHTADDLYETVITFLKNSPQDGIILTHPICDNKAIIKYLEDNQIPFARISPLYSDHNSPYVGSDDEKAAFEMTQYLISLGHTKIGFIKGHPDFAATQKRFDGYKRALTTNAIGFDEELIKQGLFTFESGEACARQLLTQDNKPTAIFASNDYMAAGVLKVAKQHNINVPSELTITGYDDAPVSKQLWPPITTIKQPIYQLGMAAVEKLVHIIKKKSYKDIDSIYDCELIIRDSSSPCIL
ncbi:LacI family DNA-binding transcriptional regulator [Thalassomonas sp. M1454]|uniref:LacI family DNA-binding transcriptional regulator n=1 Tax=Thalassomonas sp. M1454 TaxID=2594477 RepID=UPI00117F7D55|nr:LacI family DNA-binding transcriptional regulator [Thalassomonas sp. M1454]TRX53938.1 LacI family transcriptional regulator [Thalassomonas sp. M1454]